MAQLNFIGGLKKEFHHVKAINGSGEEKYEPAMFLLRDELLGKSFCIPLSCLWKYLDPKDNLDMRQMDALEFDKMCNKVFWKRKITMDPAETSEDCAAIIIAEQVNENSGILLCTAYSLAKCCQLLGFTVCSQTLAQLLMFIQDGLDQLKNMPMAEAENAVDRGEVTIEVNGKKYHHDLTLSESDILQGGE